ncbi:MULTISPECIES: PilW family protein [Pseudomonas]|uniref:Prepilin-type N-terminal cleavage/methylation domain-containing protein n=1 Tax=Pseudomonas eucalypticola TaxID=2599595 RepID=A0A7D5I033_9PSED|nr:MULTISPECIES: prepilin-type N-terminal cleavage/methylation domain-containing protein [Pseudomonas]QKZ06811.1 prepilin-type N-terminal cleavage/methylation domain-containing protein [Pseudomonas eucalypticola]
MRKHCAGFGLIELMVAILLGLIILLGVLQIFVSAKNTYLAQNASAAMQEDARYALSKMVQEIRMVGMFGCVETVTPDATAADFIAAQVSPITYVTTTVGTVTTGTLTLITGDVGSSTTPTWTILTDCVTSPSTVSAGAKTATGMIALPIRKVIYTYNSTTQQLLTVSGTTQSVLISNVAAMSVLFGMAADTSVGSPITSYTATPASAANIRSVRITLTLSDPNGRVANQTFNVVAAIRNRLP